MAFGKRKGQGSMGRFDHILLRLRKDFATNFHRPECPFPFWYPFPFQDPWAQAGNQAKAVSSVLLLPASFERSYPG